MNKYVLFGIISMLIALVGFAFYQNRQANKAAKERSESAANARAHKAAKAAMKVPESEKEFVPENEYYNEKTGT
jgi:predicted negative regulator of RcsB-dependent stress response